MQRPERERKEPTEFNVIVKAKDLVKHTFTITNSIDAKTVEQSYQSWRGHAEKGNSYHLIRRTDHYYNSLMKPKEAAQCQKH
jgi:hypothetical protein